MGPAGKHRHTIGINRREFLQVGYSGLLGVGLSSLLTQRAASTQSTRSAATPKSVILIFLTGGPSHHDTFDMKPDAPANIAGEFRPIATRVPGLQICEHLPRLAARADKYALVRTLSHRDNNHLMSTHHLLTGHFQPGTSSTRWPRATTGRITRRAWIICGRAPMVCRPGLTFRPFSCKAP